ncbi:MAG TPA: NAD(P)H-dependent oxidoreductase subunit E, partial [Ferruginibacter sp.]|nr:NAD(P)H-dependent oxidoreductase subunit E [Ferruginibacter sp.]
MSKNLGQLSGRQGLSNNLFEALGIAAAETGTPSRARMEELANEFLMGKANVFGAASFYDFLKEENKGRKVFLCNGSACLTAGTQDALKEKLSGQFDVAEIGEMCCLGRCHENSAFNYNGKNYSGNAVDQIAEVKSKKSNLADTYHVGSYGTAVLT